MEIIGKYKEFGHEFDIYNTIEDPLFLATEIGKIIDYSVGNISHMLNCVDESEKILINVPGRTIVTSGRRHNTQKWFLTEYGLYEVLMQSRKPIAKRFKTKVKQILKDLRLHGKVEREFDFDNMFKPYDLQEDFKALNDLREDHGVPLMGWEDFLKTKGLCINQYKWC